MKESTTIENVNKATSFNLTGIHIDGSPVSTQVWSSDGSPAQAAGRILAWLKNGKQDDVWNQPVVAAFIHVTATKETFSYDLTQLADIDLLHKMAGS